MKAFNEKVVLVTGAASGIGRATAESFIAAGALVFGFDRDEAGLSSVQGLQACASDVTDHETMSTHVSKIIQQHHRIDVLVNCAAISYYSSHVESTIEEWRTTMAVNLEAYYMMAKLTVPHMIAHGGGRIVNVGSTQAIASEPVVGAYSASKGGISAWTRTLAVDLAPHNILVNAVSPGCVQTAMSVINGVNEYNSKDFQEWYIKRRKIPLGRVGRPEEIAKAILFLSSEDASYITGHTLVIDGGLTIAM